MDLQGLLQIAAVILLLFLPAIILGWMVRLPRIYLLSQQSAATRTAIVMGNGLLCWAITFALLTWLACAMLYSIAGFYFEATFGSVPGITRAIVAEHNFAAITELWLRQIIPGQVGVSCFNPNPTVCQLADITAKTGSLNSMSIIFTGAALVPTFFNLLLSRHFTRPGALTESTAE